MYRVILVFALLLTIFPAVACAPQKPELIGCNPEVAKISVTDGKPMWAIITTEIKLSNPNKFPVTLDGLTLKIDNGEGIQAYEEVSKVIEVPAEGMVKESVSCNVTFMNIVSEMAMNKALSGAQAVGAAAPVWKGLPSAKPPMLPQETWDKLPAKPSTFAYETSVYTKASGEQKFVKKTGNMKCGE